MLKMPFQKKLKKKTNRGKVKPKYLFNYCERWEGFEANCFLLGPGPSILNYHQSGSYYMILFSISWIY